LDCSTAKHISSYRYFLSFMVDSLLMIKAEEILDKIEKGKPVEY